MRTLLVTNRPHEFQGGNSLIAAIMASGDVTKIYFEEGWELPSVQAYDAVVFFVKFKHLREQTSIDWKRFDGPRVLMDHDAFRDFDDWLLTPYLGEWTRHTRRLGFNLMIVSGERSQRYFTAQGFETAVVHKGFAQQHFMDLTSARSGLGHYGTPYRSRVAMLRHVRAAGIEVNDIVTPYLELNAVLNKFLAILVCNMTPAVRLGRLGQIVERKFPGTGLKLGPAPEPMEKNFESAAAGCAVFMDDAPDLETLGFADGETAIVYRDLDELIDKLRYWLARPEDLRRIGAASAELCLARHTFEHRATRLQEILEAHRR